MLCELFSFCVTQEDEKFLSEVFAQLTDEATDDDKRCELVSPCARDFWEYFDLPAQSRNIRAVLQFCHQSDISITLERTISNVASSLVLYSLEEYFLSGKNLIYLFSVTVLLLRKCQC